MRCNMKYAAIMTPLCLVIAGAMSQRFLRAQEPSTEAAQSRPPVTVQEDESSYTLANGILTARVSKQSGDLTSLVYKGMELLTDKSGHAGAYWSHDTSGGVQTIAKISIDPQSSGQDRAEVSVKGISGGRKMGHGAGAGPDGNFPADIEIRHSLGRGESGIYTYCIFEHQSDYPAASMSEARYCAKLADSFDWMSVNARHNMLYPKDLRQGDKYIYTAVQAENPAYGWSSTTKNVGFYIVNPTVEYLSGGPTKTEFLCHRDTTQAAAPCVLNYWRSSHYGGALVEVGQGEHWTKVIGPFLLYVNSGGDPQTMWKDALAQAKLESAKWPYQWVSGVDYPHREQRATVKGRLVLDDPQTPNANLPNLLVGLAYPVYDSPKVRAAGPNRSRPIDWQIDAKHYEFWVRGDESGNFSIPNVRPGKYTLHAFADGVLGEFAKTDVTVESGKSIDLGNLQWTPVRRGKQLWDIGIPNRNGSEFKNGDRYFEPDTPLQYAKLFPNDVNYVVGKSNFREDWYFEQVPHSDDPNARVVPFMGVSGSGRATPFSIAFELPNAPAGAATLRLAICGNQARSIAVTVNDQPAGTVENLGGDGAISRHAIQGMWFERELSFNASLMKQGANVLKLIVPAGSVNNGVIYDYIRLELDETAQPSASAAE
ncbi:MAG: polysaccharide lyase family 4 protein [Thermoguttaceae bacterium]